MYVQVKHSRKTKRVFSLMLLVAAMFLSCSERVETEIQEPFVNEEPEPIGLAFASVSSSSAKTRLADEIIQDVSPYRDITNFRLIALYRDVDKNIVNVASSVVDYPKMPEDKTNARYYHLGYCEMPKGSNGSLVYAKAVDGSKNGVSTSVYNGNLHVVVPDYVTSTSDIYAEPVSIINDATVGEDEIPADAWTLANALTDIASIENWNAMNDNNLKPLLDHFTNYGYDLAGSAASVRSWIGAVKKSAEDMGSLGDGRVEESIRQEIIAKADEYLWLDQTKLESAKSIRTMTYPQNNNLPDGAAVLRWTEVEGEGGTKVKKFVPQLQTTTLDDINSVSRFVYPPALYYFVESGIWTSKNKVTFDQYKGRSSWKGDDDDAVQKLFSDGGTILSNTKTVAIEDPLQYAVARLNLTVEVDADATELKYNVNNTIPYKEGDNYNFRLTGVIVGGQRKVGYDFKPIDNSDMDVKFVYDSQVPGNFYLKKKTDYPSSTLEPVNTLVLQSYDGEDINVILEFEYTAATEDATEFKCLDGYVYPGTRFYLVGEVKANDFKAGTGDAMSQGRVFTQDYTTTIEMTVKSLEKAYNVLPNIISKNLEIGVMTTPKWKAATPSDPVIME